MSWNQSTDDEIGRFIAKNQGSASAHLPFLTVYDRNHFITLRYLQVRVEPEQALQFNELLWKHAWKQAGSFPSSTLSYRGWLLELADRIVLQPRKDPKSTGAMAGAIDSKRIAVIEQTLLKLSIDRRKVFCLRARGASEAEILSALGIDRTRSDHWLALAGTQLESILNSTP